MLSTTLITNQTGPEGVPVNQVLVEELADIAKEMYLALTVDRGGASSRDAGQRVGRDGY